MPYRQMIAITEMLEALDKVAPGVNSRHTLFYMASKVKFYSSRLKLSNVLESEIPNFFAAGDGAGVTRGLWRRHQPPVVVVAREILAREAANASI